MQKNFVGNFEILGNSNILSKIEMLKEEKDIIIDDSIAWSHSELEIMERIERKLVWVMQPNINKQQTISLGMLSRNVFQKWMWSQRSVAKKFSERQRLMFMNGLREKQDFCSVTFDGEEMPVIISSHWNHKTWEYTDLDTLEVTKMKAEMVQLTLTYNNYLEELNARIRFVCFVKDDEGDWMSRFFCTFFVQCLDFFVHFL